MVIVLSILTLYRDRYPVTSRMQRVSFINLFVSDTILIFFHHWYLGMGVTLEPEKPALNSPRL